MFTKGEIQKLYKLSKSAKYKEFEKALKSTTEDRFAKIINSKTKTAHSEYLSKAKKLTEIASSINRELGEIKKLKIKPKVKIPKVVKVVIVKYPNGPYTPNDLLAKMIGKKSGTMSSILQRTWDYIKANGLQKKENKRYILAYKDIHMSKMTKHKEISMFELAPLIKRNCKKKV